MHGNVLTWVKGPKMPGPPIRYESYDPDDDYWESIHEYRIVSGGSFNDGAFRCQSAHRSYRDEYEGAGWLGIRLAITPVVELFKDDYSVLSRKPERAPKAPESMEEPAGRLSPPNSENPQKEKKSAPGRMERWLSSLANKLRRRK